MAGWAQNAQGTVLPVLWNGNNTTTLPTLGGTSGALSAINNAGMAVGSSSLADGTSHAALWSGGTVRDLGTLGGSYSVASAINNPGTVAGTSYDSSGHELACLWSASGPVNLSSLGGGSFTSVRGINDSGNLILWGTPYGATGNHATFWSGDASAVPVDLGTFGGAESWAYGLNNSGLVVGAADLEDTTYHAFIWDGTSKTDLGTLTGGFYSTAFGINDQGDVVGFSLDAAGHTHAVEWVPMSVPEPSVVVQGVLWGTAMGLWARRRRNKS